MMEIKKTSIPLIKGVDLSMRKLPMIQITSGKKGPIVWITAAIHGDEVTGISIIHSLLSKLQRYPLKNGQLYFFPIMNPAGFETISRHEPFGETDLNRQFPGDVSGSTAERLAHVIFQTIRNTHPNFVIDLHTDSNNSVAYTIVDSISQNKTTTKEAIMLAQSLGFPWALDQTFADYDPTTSLTGSLMLAGIPAVTIELGGPMVVNEYFRKTGLDNLWLFLQSFDMVPSHSPIYPKEKIPQQMYIFEKRIECDDTGIIDYRVKPGDTFKRGDILGKIRNIYGKEIEIIRAPSSGMLFSHEDQSIAFPGQTLFTYVTSKSTQELFPDW